MNAPEITRMVALLGEIARQGRSGRLRIGTVVLVFSGGSLAGCDGVPGLTPGAPLDLAALRRELPAMLRGAGAGVSTEFATTPASPPPGGALSAADLALEIARQIDDPVWLKREIMAGVGARLRVSATPPASRPHASLGPAEGFLLSRADGTLTLEQILDTAPLGEIETLRAIYALTAVGLLSSPAGRPGAARLDNLDRFLSRTAAPGHHPASAAAAAAPAAGAPASRYTPDEEKERQDLLAKCRGVVGQDHYTTLGVEQTAGESAIRHAYYHLARLYHPDRLIKPHLEDISNQLEGMFAAITDAYNTLSHPDLRGEYDREMAGAKAGRGRSGQDRNQAARESYLRGRKEAEAGRLFEAIRLYEISVELDPTRAEYFHHLGVCQGQNPRWRKKAEESLLTAITLNPGAARSYLELARVYQKGGLGRRALEMYEKVLAWEPANEEALTALGRGKDATSSGLLGGLFKKE